MNGELGKVHNLENFFVDYMVNPGQWAMLQGMRPMRN